MYKHKHLTQIGSKIEYNYRRWK